MNSLLIYTHLLVVVVLMEEIKYRFYLKIKLIKYLDIYPQNVNTVNILINI
jgi:hypothetical protein